LLCGHPGTALDKTTSDLLPSQTPADLVNSLQLADYIRSSQVTPIAATRSFQRRLKHSNPNVQLLALQVLDISIKNGGTPFLLQAGGNKDLVNDLQQMARNSSNSDVRQSTLTKLQAWATAFQAKDNLQHLELVKTYQRMQSDPSLQFPQRDLHQTAAMVDSLSVSFNSPYSYTSSARIADSHGHPSLLTCTH
jgi:growth factor-regulated tyrosine kinase substrate